MKSIKFDGFSDWEAKSKDNHNDEKNEGSNFGNLLQGPLAGSNFPNLLSSLMGMLGGLGFNINNIQGVDLDELNDFMQGALGNTENPGELFKTIAANAGKPEKENVSIHSSHLFLTLKQNQQINSPCAVKSGIKMNFFQEFGESQSYDPNIFVDTAFDILGDDGEIWNEIKQLILIDTSENYILFRAIPNDETKESFIIAIAEEGSETAEEDNTFIMYVPRFGNSIMIDDDEDETIRLIDSEIDADLFDDEGNLRKVADINKIKAECDLVFYDEKRAMVSVSDFGRILQIQKEPKLGGDGIFVGTIHSNKSYKATQFLKDFDLNEDETTFNFYVKLKGTCSKRTLTYISEFLPSINFKTNPMIQRSEILPYLDGIAIELNLEELERNIDRWANED